MVNSSIRTVMEYLWQPNWMHHLQMDRIMLIFLHLLHFCQTMVSNQVTYNHPRFNNNNSFHNNRLSIIALIAILVKFVWQEPILWEREAQMIQITKMEKMGKMEKVLTTLNSTYVKIVQNKLQRMMMMTWKSTN